MNIPKADASYWEIEKFIDKIINDNCVEVPYEGTTISKESIKQEFLSFLREYRKDFTAHHLNEQKEAIKAKLGEGLIDQFGIFLTDDFDFEETGNSMIENAYPLENIE